MTKTLVLIRGLPGSGKTTYAHDMMRRFHGRIWAVHLEADQHFYRLGNGQYAFDASKLKDAHLECLNRAKAALANGLDSFVLVSNTFTTWEECFPYVASAVNVGAQVCIVDMLGSYGSVHNVPDKTIRRMKQRWVPAEFIAHKALQLGATVSISKEHKKCA